MIVVFIFLLLSDFLFFAHNDVAFVAPPQGRPIVIASYVSGGDVPNTIRAELHRAVAQLVTAELAAGDRDRGSQRIR